MINRYPLWKNCLLVLILLFGCVYAAPNLYPDQPVVQISLPLGVENSDTLLQQIRQLIESNHIEQATVQPGEKTILIKLQDTDTQLKLRDILSKALGDDYTVAVNLMPATPLWLQHLNAAPMKLGLDLRGGVHFTLEIDMKTVIAQRTHDILKNISDSLRQASIRYIGIFQKNNQINLGFRDLDALNKAKHLLSQQFSELQLTAHETDKRFFLIIQWREESLSVIKKRALEQTMKTLRNRINELGIAEPLVQQQGDDRITVDLPGVQDTVRAQQILGATATLEFRLVDTGPSTATSPIGSRSYAFEGRPVLLSDKVILKGDSIVDAFASFGEDGRPSVSVSLGGGNESFFHRITGENIGKPLAILYVETKAKTQVVGQQTVFLPRKVERVISIATIQTALPANFQITGLSASQEAINLALLLRAGALPAPVYVVEERTIGPQLGAENIRMGFLSITVGFLLAILFMGIYYRSFGLLADIALLMNLILLVALLSLLGMTLTLSGMAAIVLTVGMAVDADVLIFERIREEIRNGSSPQASIQAGYERALATIVDANVATLIAALVLFGIGTGPIKAFALTLILGLLTSMLTGIMLTRALVNACFGGRTLKKLPIGC